MLSTELRNQANEDIVFTTENLKHLQNKIVELDGVDKALYDQGIVKLELDVLADLENVNRGFADVKDAYDDRIVSGCRTDMFWRLVGIDSMSDPINYNLECTRLNSGGYSLTTSSIAYQEDGDEPIGLGASVGYVGATGIVTYYPANANYEGDPAPGIVDDPYFGFDRRNRYGLKYYIEPYGVDIGDTVVGKFIGTCSAGSQTVTVMQPVGIGLTFEVGQLVSVAKTSVFTATREITGLTTVADFDLRAIPGIGTTAGTVNLLTLNLAVGDDASAPEVDGSFVEFTLLDDPDEFQDQGRRAYEIEFTKNPFVPQTIAIATTETVGVGVSVFLTQTGDLPNERSWNSNLEPLGTPEPKVSAGQEFYRVGFAHAPMSGGSRATEGTVISVDDITLGIYQKLDDCSTAVEDAITDALGISSTRETALISQEADTLLKLDASQALRDERNDVSIQIFGIRKIIGEENDKVDKLERLKVFLDNSTITDVVE
jgi:Arc/MetJ family transcription regulator|tara:strand:- start:247 stop:1704 length:1458 start_codon:yes stop_codon:yes gene_type:complete